MYGSHDAHVPSASSSCLRLLGRAFVMTPVGAVGIGLTATVVGAVVGIPLLIWAGKWIAKPIQQHPNFRIPTQQEQRLRRDMESRSSADQYMNTAQQYTTPTQWFEEEL
jgi:hypothetical protein